jgi:translation initiation factor 1
MSKTPRPPATGGPFAHLAALRDTLPPGAAPPPEAPAAVPAAPPPRGPARAVVRYERAGRRGKEATVIEKLGLGAAELEAWCKALKQALGCGGAVDGDGIVLQGDQRTRLEALLVARGVRKITIA